MSFRLQTPRRPEENADAGDSNQKRPCRVIAFGEFRLRMPASSRLGQLQVDTIHYSGGWRCQNATKLAGGRELNFFPFLSLISTIPFKANHFSTSWFFDARRSSSLDIFRCSDTVKRRAELFVRSGKRWEANERHPRHTGVSLTISSSFLPFRTL